MIQNKIPQELTNIQKHQSSPLQSSTNIPTSQDRDFIAYAMMATACLIWTLSYIYSNENNMDTYEANIAKGVIGTLLNYFVINQWNIETHMNKSSTFMGIFIINLCVLAYLFSLPPSQQYLPLPIVHTIGCSSIAMVYVIDYFMNGITITKKGFIGVILSLVGVFLMANSRLVLNLFNSSFVFDSSFNNYKESSIMFSSFVALVLFVSRAFNSYGIVKLKHYPQVSVFELNLQNNIMGLFIGAIGYMFKNTHTPMEIFWPSFFTLGVGQFTCMTCFFYSFKLTKKAGNLMIINTVNIMTAFFVSYFRYGEKINWLILIGSMSLCISIVIVISESRKSFTNRTKEAENKSETN